jgi:hypothetical protein
MKKRTALIKSNRMYQWYQLALLNHGLQRITLSDGFFHGAILGSMRQRKEDGDAAIKSGTLEKSLRLAVNG